MHWRDEVLGFWFGGLEDADLDRPREAWFTKDATFDDAIRERFDALVASIEAGTTRTSGQDAREVLAFVVAADQFPRNLFRGGARAFACDPIALAVARAALSAGLDQELPPVARWFLYLPLEHSESLADQDESVRRFESLPADSAGRAGVVDYARRHRVIVERFGRFPHRNVALGRTSTDEELRFLQEPGSSF